LFNLINASVIIITLQISEILFVLCKIYVNVF